MTKQPSMITYKFKYAATSSKHSEIKPQNLVKHLEERLQIDMKIPNLAEIVMRNVQTVTPKCLAFDFPEIYLKKMETLQHEQHPDYEIIRVSAISQLVNEKVQEDELPQYSQEQYDEAMYNNFEVYIGRLQPDTDAYELQRAFHKKGIKFVNLDVKCKEGKKGFAFMKCLTEKDMENAISLDGEMAFGGKKIEIRAAT